MKTSELTGAQLDYWTARAEGIPAAQLTIRRGQRSTAHHVVRDWVRNDPVIGRDVAVLAPSTNWAQGGPLIEKYKLDLQYVAYDPDLWAAYDEDSTYEQGDTPLQAICRAVVRAAFGDEVEEVTVCD